MSKLVKMSINIDSDLKKDLKILAIKKDTTVTQIIDTIIREYVENEKK